MAEHVTATHAPALDADAFRAIFSMHPAGVSVITADAGAGPVAMTATSVISVSAEPPRLLFSVGETTSSASTFRSAETVLIHFLDAGGVGLAIAASTHGADRFADESAWTRLPSGEPLFLGVPVWIRARMLQRIGAGAATVVLAEPLESSAPAEYLSMSRNSLVYVGRTWHQLDSASRLTT